MDIDKINSRLGAHRYLRAIHIGWENERAERDNGLSLTISLSREADSPDGIMTLQFFSISSLKLEIAGGGKSPAQVDLTICDVRDRQWDGLSYRVFEYEQKEQIAFYCRKWSVIES